MATTDVQAVDEGKLEQVLGQLVTDMGAAMNGVLVLIGVELGLWRALDNAGPLTADAWPNEPVCASAMCGSGCRRRPQAAT